MEDIISFLSSDVAGCTKQELEFFSSVIHLTTGRGFDFPNHDDSTSYNRLDTSSFLSFLLRRAAEGNRLSENPDLLRFEKFSSSFSRVSSDLNATNSFLVVETEVSV